jgi:hypothetical protein
VKQSQANKRDFTLPVFLNRPCWDSQQGRFFYSVNPIGFSGVLSRLPFFSTIILAAG